jgi:spoIIIJ-associated protein
MAAVEEIKEIASELFELLGLKVDFKVKEEEDVVYLDIEAPEATGLLIGRHGETLNAIQSFLAMAIKQSTGEWVRVVVNIGDWRQKQEEQLVKLADQAAARATETGQPQYLYNLNATQRRMVHLALAENKSVETQSEGEGNERYLVVKPK